ncbi:MAG: DUF4397 domain-containing protein [Gammaproteobacteria bacterium]
MKYQTTLRVRVLAIALLGTSLLAAGCGDTKNKTADLRVIHASKDAPPVNVRVGNKDEIANLDYADSSGYVPIRAGSRRIAVEAIIPGGNADVITVDRFEFRQDLRYNILAINDTASIAPLVVEETAGEPELDEVAIAVVHASPDAGTVDVYLTPPGTDVNTVGPNFSFDYTDVVDAGVIPADNYRIQVTLAGDKNVVYDSGSVDLSTFGGEKLLIAALSSENGTEAKASPIKLLVANDIDQVQLVDADTEVGARVVHLSPDAGIAAGGPVEVFATSTALGGTAEIIDAFEYADQFPGAGAYAGIPAGVYDFAVAPDGAGVGGALPDSLNAADLMTASEYTVIAAGNVSGSPAFDLLATADDNRAIVTQASVKVVHGAPAAGIVDVYVTPAGAFTATEVEMGMAGDPLLDDFQFGEITPYVAVPPGDYDIRVVTNGGVGGTAAINVEGFTLPAGLVATAIARQPDGDGSAPTDFGLLVLTN